MAGTPRDSGSVGTNYFIGDAPAKKKREMKTVPEEIVTPQPVQTAGK